MVKLLWDQVGKREYETGVSKGALYVQAANGSYPKGVSWSGLTAVTESPSGAEANPKYADNIKYLNLYSAEEFGGTIEAFYYPDEFAECDGSASVIPGVNFGQQARTPFGLVYQTLLGNDTVGNRHGYKLHLVYSAMVSPTEKSYTTINDSPEPVTFSWEFTTTPTPVTTLVDGKALQPTSYIVIDSTKVDPTKLKALEDKLFGTTETEPTLPSPDEVYTLLKAAG